MGSFEKISSGKPDNPWAALENYHFDPSDEDEPVANERLSKKPLDIFVRQIFELRPELINKTQGVLESYCSHNKKLPFLHITPDIIEYEDGEYASTGNVDNIRNNGFLPGDSNVGGFVAAGNHYNNVGNPESFKTPEALLKSYVVLLRHYLHHASRLNHRNSEAIEGKKIKAVRPAFILVRGDLKVDHGTDYEDHFILRNGSAPNDILGVMSVNEKIDLGDHDSIAESWNNLINLITDR